MSYDPKEATISEAEAFALGYEAGLAAALAAAPVFIGVDFALSPDITAVGWRHSPPGEEPTGLEVRGE